MWSGRKLGRKQRAEPEKDGCKGKAGGLPDRTEKPEDQAAGPKNREPVAFTVFWAWRAVRLVNDSRR